MLSPAYEGIRLRGRPDRAPSVLARGFRPCVYELRQYPQARFVLPTTVAWVLLEDGDAEAIRAEIAAGRTGAARGLLLNRAVELISLGAAIPRPGHPI
jgi:hypothetical protein